MKLDIKYTRLIVILLGVFISGFIYWPIPYEEIDLINEQFILKWSGMAILLSIIASFVFREHYKLIGIWITMGYLLTIVSRVIGDSFFRDTAHNLFFFEVIFAIVTIAPPALLSSYITGSILKKISTTNTDLPN